MGHYVYTFYRPGGTGKFIHRVEIKDGESEQEALQRWKAEYDRGTPKREAERKRDEEYWHRVWLRRRHGQPTTATC